MNLNEYRILKDHFTHPGRVTKDIDDPLISSLINGINQNQIDEKHELLLTIRKVLWNQEDIIEIEDIDKIIIGAIIFWKNGYINTVDLKVLVNQLLINNRLEDQKLNKIADLLISEQATSDLDKWIELIRLKFEDLGNYIPKLSSVLRTYELLYNGTTEAYQSLATLVDSLLSRPEYFNELVGYTSPEELLRALPWLNWDNKRLVTDFLIDKELALPKDEDFDKNISSKISSPDSILYEMPK
ncbi:MAG: hypothetical protein ACC656_11885, partial [Candidatus Heimdallarchaeota archaeon]